MIRKEFFAKKIPPQDGPMDQFIFNYKKYKSDAISVEQLDGIANIILTAGNGTVNNIIAGLKLLLIFAWLFARKTLIDAEREIAQQEYLIEQNRRDRDEVDDPFGRKQ